MKTSKLIRFIAVLFLFTICFQSCKVYQSQHVPVEEAILSQKRVKVITVNNDKYFFKKLFVKQDTLYGVTKINSVTAKKLDNKIIRCTVDGKMAKIILDTNSIKGIYLQK